ncbi:MmgE/PrpD family protein [Roseovarius amoyensis]|uniref:MmgE/PrpD family protein n=1 Tax=Roseovarius amoyensis TaxID=2211448 RepID=UPI000DBE5C06|nr:MmgE/PrpD family protein [Roseovarius amoyensis]
MITTPTAQLSAFVANMRFDDLPPEAVHQACRFLLDAVGCAISAHAEDPAKANRAMQLVAGFHASGSASIIGGAPSDPALAALANGILINATDYDDTHKRALIHVGSVVAPAALAATEQAGGSGPQLITAMIAGYEVAARIGMAVMPTHYRFWHSTATNGTFGAAAAASRAMGLDAAQTETALGHAATQAAGLNTFFETGSDTKSIHPGKAGLNGILSARMAALDLSSPPDSLGHPKGYLAAFSADPRPEALTRGLGHDWEILENGFKYYPSILASHSPIGASLDIVTRNAPSPDAIAAVRVRTYATVKTHFSSTNVDSAMAARLSVPYCVAAALSDGQVTQAQFQPDRFRDSALRQLMNRVEIIADDNLTALYPEKFPARVSVHMQDGEIHEAGLDYPKGDPRNPLSDAELLNKYRRNTARTLPPQQAEDLAQAIMALPDAPDLHRISALLRGADDGQQSTRTRS